MTMSRSRGLAPAALLVLLAAGLVPPEVRADRAQRQSRPPPPASDASPSAIARLVGTGQRVAIYVRPRSLSCEGLLRKVEANPAIASSARVSVVVGGAT